MVAAPLSNAASKRPSVEELAYKVVPSNVVATSEVAATDEEVQCEIENLKFAMEHQLRVIKGPNATEQNYDKICVIKQRLEVLASDLFSRK